jgi:hypothetical protein
MRLGDHFIHPRFYRKTSVLPPWGDRFLPHPLHASAERTIVRPMRPGESTPWRPEPLDQLLQEPFERIEEQRGEMLLQRLDELCAELEEMEAELDRMLQEAAHCR